MNVLSHFTVTVTIYLCSPRPGGRDRSPHQARETRRDSSRARRSSARRPQMLLHASTFPRPRGQRLPLPAQRPRRPPRPALPLGTAGRAGLRLRPRRGVGRRHGPGCGAPCARGGRARPAVAPQRRAPGAPEASRGFPARPRPRGDAGPARAGAAERGGGGAVRAGPPRLPIRRRRPEPAQGSGPAALLGRALPAAALLRAAHTRASTREAGAVGEGGGEGGGEGPSRAGTAAPLPAGRPAAGGPLRGRARAGGLQPRLRGSGWRWAPPARSARGWGPAALTENLLPGRFVFLRNAPGATSRAALC